MRNIRVWAAQGAEWALPVLLVLSVLWRGGKGLEATWLLAAFAVAITFIRWWNEPAGKRFSPMLSGWVWGLLLLFLSWSLVSFLFSRTQNYGLDELLRDAALVLIASWVSARQERDDAGALTRRLAVAMAAALLLACVIGAAVYVLQPVNRFVGTFFDWRFHTDYWPNAWAQAILLLWPAVLLACARRPAWVRVLCLGIVIGALFLSYSRGALIAFGSQLCLFVLLLGVRWLRGGRKMSVITTALWPAGLMIATTALLAATVFTGINATRAQYHQVESVTRKATFTAEEGSTSISERRDFWEQSLRLSMERPWFGWGPYSFRFTQPRLQTEVFATSDHPHNVFLKLAMERGWPSAMFFAAVFLIVLGFALLRATSPVDREKEPHRILFIVALSGVLAHNLIDYNLQFTGVALPFWLMAGAIAPRSLPTIGTRRVFRTAELALAIILGCTVMLEGRYLALSSLGRHAEAAGKTEEALYWYGRAHRQIFSRDMHMSRAALHLQRGETAEAEAALADYAATNAEDPRLWILRGYAALARQDQQKAYVHFSAALRLGRYDYLEPLEGAIRILVHGQYPGDVPARKEEFLQTFRAFGDAILHNAHFIALSESVEAFDRVSVLLQTLYPEERAALSAFATEVLAHAREERLRSSARTPGMLW